MFTRFTLLLAIAVLCSCSFTPSAPKKACTVCQPAIRDSLRTSGPGPTLRSLARSQLAWIKSHTPYQTGLEQLPIFLFLPRALMQRRAWQNVNYRVGGGHWRGIVVLPSDFQFTDADISTMFHELVHYAQYKNGWPFSSFCDLDREREAYQLQTIWYRQHIDPDRKPFGNLAKIAVANRCQPPK